MTPFEHLMAKLKHAQGIDADAVRCDIEELASVLEELKDLRKCVKSSAFQDGYIKALDDMSKIGADNAIVRQLSLQFMEGIIQER